MRDQRKVRAVLFDLGNTLVTYYVAADFPAVLQRCLRECMNALGWSQDSGRDHAMFVRAMALNPERPDNAVRALDQRLSELFGGDASLDDATLTALCEAFLKPIFDLARLDPDALPVLEMLRQRGIKTAIVSNSPWGSSANAWRNEVARHGLLDRVDAAVFCGDVGWRKPNPAPFQRALELIDVAPPDAIFVGDDARWDVVGAQNAGLRPVLLCRLECRSSKDAYQSIAFTAFSTFSIGPNHERWSARLLPRFGGPEMYGDRVFDAVLEAGETESGVSIHLVDADYDTGAIVRQCSVPVLPGDSLEDLKARVRAREKEFLVRNACAHRQRRNPSFQQAVKKQSTSSAACLLFYFAAEAQNPSPEAGR